MSRLDNVARVVANGLCNGCGTCAGVCPSDAIEMCVVEGLFLPNVNEGNCTECGLCIKCCPGFAVDFEKLNLTIFEGQPKDVFLGNFSNCYVGHSNDVNIRFESSSGGIVPELLVFALEKGLIDGVLVVRMTENNPLEPEPFIARTRKEIVSASKSKYCPVATNVLLRTIFSEDGKFAVVGLPCHMHGIRKAEEVFEGLRDKMVLHIGLFCGHTVDFVGTELLLRKFGVKKNDVAGIEYRGHGRPGFMSIRLKDGRILKFRFNKGWKAYWNFFSSFLFTPLRCLTCPDHFNELADVSLGDAWLTELEGSKLGESIVIARTKIAEEIVGLMSSSSKLSLHEITSSKAKESQAFSLNFKKENFSGRLSFLRMLGKSTPRINPMWNSSSFWAFVGAFLTYFSFIVSSKKSLRAVLPYVPLAVFRLYFGLFKCVFLLSHNRQL